MEVNHENIIVKNINLDTILANLEINALIKCVVSIAKYQLNPNYFNTFNSYYTDHTQPDLQLAKAQVVNWMPRNDIAFSQVTLRFFFVRNRVFSQPLVS